MTTAPEHPDLRNLRMWIDRIASDYHRLNTHRSRRFGRERRDLEMLRLAADGRGRGRSRDQLRALIAAGVIRYRQEVDIPQDPLPEMLMLDFVVDAIWPIVIAEELPDAWLEDLSIIASPQFAMFVNYARAACAEGNPVAKSLFQRAIAQRNFAVGIVNMLDDLNDPRRGGSYLKLVAEAAAGETPDSDRSTPKRLLRWILAGAMAGSAAAATGVIGNRVDALVVELWEWLQDQIEPDIGSILTGGRSGAGALEQWLGNGGDRTASGNSSVLDGIVDSFFDR